MGGGRERYEYTKELLTHPPRFRVILSKPILIKCCMKTLAMLHMSSTTVSGTKLCKILRRIFLQKL